MNQDILLAGDALTVPSVSGRSPRVFDMRRINRAEARYCELASINKAKAGELQAVLIAAYTEARRYLALAKEDFARAKQRLRSTEGIVTLDRAPGLLSAKGMTSARSPAGSEDLRKSVVNTDEEYLRVADVLLEVEAIVELFDGICEGLKMAYYCVGDLTKGTDLTKRDTSGGIGSDDPGTKDRYETARQFAGKHATNVPDDDFGDVKF